MTTKTLINWLSDPEYNLRRSYRDLIHTAYENVATVPIPDHVKNGQFEISGVVKTGDDERVRGTRRAAPLRIDGSRGDWNEIEALWMAGVLTDDDFEDHFIDDVIVADIGEGTDGWDFPGASYSVELRFCCRWRSCRPCTTPPTAPLRSVRSARWRWLWRRPCPTPAPSRRRFSGMVQRIPRPRR
ncbi:hypothetical protein [Streptomyces cellulosae]|uniref:Uncharacterized protein n=1 Tax=Streptomyces cellulosae TaxID=1968 RepID=A0ABW7YID1_STRCE